MKIDKIKYGITGVVIFIAMATGLYGCASPPQRNVQAKKVFQEKCHEEFEIIFHKKDSYVMKRICDRMSNKISQNLSTLKNDYYVFTEAMFSDSLLTDPEISLEAYIQGEPANKFTIYLCLEQKETNIENIVSSINHMIIYMVNLMKWLRTHALVL